MNRDFGGPGVPHCGSLPLTPLPHTFLAAFARTRKESEPRARNMMIRSIVPRNPRLMAFVVCC